MDNRFRPQNACDFPGSPRWLIASAGKGPPAFMWVLLRHAVGSDSPLGRSLKRAYCKIVRGFAYPDGRVAILVKGNIHELDRLIRLHKSRAFHPELVEGAWMGALPVPGVLLNLKLIADIRHIQVIGLDMSRVPNEELLDRLSLDANIDLLLAERKPVPMGVLVVMAGKGRRECVAAIEEVHLAGQLLSPGREQVVLAIHSDEVSELPIDYPLWRVVEWRNSGQGQLARLYGMIVHALPDGHVIECKNKPPRPGESVGAVVRIGMVRQAIDERNRVAQIIDEACEQLGIPGMSYWVERNES